jgi:hypothetical protein
MSAAKSNTLRRLVRRLNADAHGDESEALKLVDVLMREYAFTRHPLTKDAEQFSDDLRRLVADWMCTPNAERQGRREATYPARSVGQEVDRA